MNDLDALDKLEAAATKGLWERWEEHADVFANVKKNTRGVMIGECVLECTDDSDEGEALAWANAAFIAALRNAYPALAAAIVDAILAAGEGR